MSLLHYQPLCCKDLLFEALILDKRFSSDMLDICRVTIPSATELYLHPHDSSSVEKETVINVGETGDSLITEVSVGFLLVRGCWILMYFVCSTYKDNVHDK